MCVCVCVCIYIYIYLLQYTCIIFIILIDIVFATMSSIIGISAPERGTCWKWMLLELAT